MNNILISLGLVVVRMRASTKDYLYTVVINELYIMHERCGHKDSNGFQLK